MIDQFAYCLNFTAYVFVSLALYILNDGSNINSKIYLCLIYVQYVFKYT